MSDASVVLYLRAVSEGLIGVISPSKLNSANLIINRYESDRYSLSHAIDLLNNIHSNYAGKGEAWAIANNEQAESSDSVESVTIPITLKHKTIADEITPCEEEECETCSEAAADCDDATGTQLGVFCRCTDANTVDTTAVARGSTASNEHFTAFMLCLADGMPFQGNHYHSSTGLSEDCKVLMPQDRELACQLALTGDVVSCGDVG